MEGCEGGLGWAEDADVETRIGSKLKVVGSFCCVIKDTGKGSDGGGIFDLQKIGRAHV